MKTSVQTDEKRAGAQTDTAAFTFPTFDKAAAVLAKHGYDPLPVETRKKYPVLDLAKRLSIESWEHYRFAAAHAEHFRQKGIGILTARTPAVDVDVRDPDMVAEIDAMVVELLGAAPARIGQAPKLLRVYRLDGAPFAKKQTRGYRLPGDSPEDKAHRVEILATGQQFVAFNLHAVTKRAYQWNGSGSPLTVPVADLPTITEAQAEEIIRRAEAILASRGTPVGRLTEADEGRGHVSGEQQRAEDPELLREALAAIANDDLGYDDWVRVLYAVKGALGEDGLEAFLAWSARSRKDRPDFSRKEFLAAKPQKIGAGTIMYLAHLAGWKRPQKTGSEQPWPKPGNLLRDRAAPSFETGDLPHVLGEYADLFSRYTGFDPSIALPTVVGVAAAALNDEITICGDQATGWEESARLWVLIVAPSGEGKDPAQKAMLSPLQVIHNKAQAAYKEEIADWKILADAAAKKREPQPDPPPQPAVLVTDTTIEALSDDLAEHPRGLCIRTDEFHTWLGGFDQYRGGSGKISAERGHWMAAFEGGERTIKRVKRGNVHVPNWGVSIITATTPAALREMATALGPTDGLFQRFFILMARHQRNVPPQERPSEVELDEARKRYSALIEKLWAMQPMSLLDRECMGGDGSVQLTAPAKELFERWRSENKTQKRAFENADEAFAQHLAKHPTMLLRVALTFHAAEAADRDEKELKNPVSLSTMQQAAQFMRRVGQHALVAYLNRSGGGQGFTLARDLARFILTRGTERNEHGLERNELVTRVASFREADDEVRSAALDLLIDFGWLRVNDGTGTGRGRRYNKAGPTRWHINPLLEEAFAEEAELEREQRKMRFQALQQRVAGG